MHCFSDFSQGASTWAVKYWWRLWRWTDHNYLKLLAWCICILWAKNDDNASCSYKGVWDERPSRGGPSHSGRQRWLRDRQHRDPDDLGQRGFWEVQRSLHWQWGRWLFWQVENLEEERLHSGVERRGWEKRGDAFEEVPEAQLRGKRASGWALGGEGEPEVGDLQCNAGDHEQPGGAVAQAVGVPQVLITITITITITKTTMIIINWYPLGWKKFSLLQLFTLLLTLR